MSAALQHARDMRTRCVRVRARAASTALIAALVLLLAAPATSTAGTVLGTSGCTAETALALPAPNGGGTSTTSSDCTIQFGSGDATAMLHAYQSDGGGSALTRPSTGELDTGFSGNGHLEDDNSAGADEYRGVAIQPDGKVVVLGFRGTGLDMYVRRYLTDGSLDPAFGVGGERLLAGTYEARDLALAPDGSIYVTGYGGSRVQVAKLTPEGNLDPTWNGGTWTNHLFSAAGGSGINAESIIVGRGGEVYVGGYTSLRGEDDFAVINYTSTGQLDTTFDGDGFRVIDIGATDEGRSIIEQPDGRIVLLGTAAMANTDVGIVRLLPSGALDTTFNGTGIRTISMSAAFERSRGLALRPSGKLVIGGNYWNGASSDAYVLQLNADGSSDTSFAPGGLVTIARPGTNEEVFDLALDPSGAVVLAGMQGASELMLHRVSATGQVDARFDGDGTWSYDAGSATDEDLRAVTVGHDGRIAAGGRKGDGLQSAQLVVLDVERVPDFDDAGTDFGAGGSGFGTCLRAIGGGALVDATTWSVNATCPTTAGAWWNGVPQGYGAASKVAATTGSGVVEATASLRFGLELDGTEPPGSYLAPITIDVVAPNLDPPANTAVPTISGTVQAKQLLTATTGTWSGSSPITYTYQWQRCTPGCADIAGATTSTYRPTLADVGAPVRVVVTATNSIGTATANSAQTGNVAAAATISAFWITGFEHETSSTAGGGLATGIAGAGSNTVDTTVKRSGNASMRFTSAANHREWDVATPATQTGAARIYVNFSSFPAAGENTFIEFDSSDAYFCELLITSAGLVRARSTRPLLAGAFQNGPTLQTNRWYRIDLGCDMSTATVRTRWSINGTTQTDAIVGGSTPVSITNVQLGIDDGTVVTMSSRYDDIVATSNVADYPIGPGKVVGLRPNGTGTHTSPTSFDVSTNDGGSWTNITAADANQSPGTAQRLDDWPVTTGGTADLVRQSGAGGDLRYTLDDLPSTDSDSAVNGVSLLVGASGAGNQNLTVSASAGAGPAAVINTDPSPGLEYRRAVMSTVPISGAAWSKSTVDGAQIHLSSSDVAPPPEVRAILAEVDVATGAAPENAVLPRITGPTKVGEQLATTTGTWVPASGVTFSYQWQNCPTPVTCADIAGATSATYTLVAGDQGDTIRVRVRASAGGDTGSATSLRTFAIGSASPTLTSMDGFEVGSLITNGDLYSSTTATNGTVSVDDTYARNGQFSARIESNGGGGSTSIAWPLVGSIGVLRVGVRLDMAPTNGGYRELVEFRNPDGTNCEINYDPATGIFGANISGTRQTGPSMQVGRWYVLDLRCDSSTGTRRLDWSVDGDPQTQVARAVIANPFSEASIGNTLGGTGAYTANFDDVVISMTSTDFPIGNGAIDPLLPWRSGVHATPGNFDSTTNGGGAWNVVAPEDQVMPGVTGVLDDVPTTFSPFATSDAVRQRVLGGYLELNLADSERSVPPTSVRGIGVHGTPTAATVQNVQLTAIVGAPTQALYLPLPHDPGGAANALSANAGLMNQIPGGGAWTVAHVNNLRLQLSSTNVGANDAQRPWTHTVLAEASFATGEAPTFTDPPQVQQPWGSVKVGDELGADRGSVTSATPVDRSWQWLRCDVTGLSCSAIDGEVGETYVVTVSDIGFTIKVVDVARNESGTQTSTSSNQTGIVATAPSIVVMTGFEGGTGVTGSGIEFTMTGSPTFSATAARSGLTGFYANNAAVNDYASLAIPTPGSVGVLRTYLRVEDATPEFRQELLSLRATATSRSCDVDLGTGGVLTAEHYDGASRDTQNGPTLVANRWYLVDLRMNATGGTWRCDWSVDGVPQPTSSWTYGAAGTVNEAFFGAAGDADDVSLIDDLAISTTLTDYPIGPGRTTALVPWAEGAHANSGGFGSDAGALGANPEWRIAEGPVWSIVDWLAQTGAGAGDYLEWQLDDPAERSAPARAVRGMVGFHSSSALGNNGITKVVRSADTDAAAPVVYSGNMSFTTTRWTGAMIPAPAGGWIVSQLDALRMRTGYSTDVTPNPRWEAAFVEVEYRQ
jgi:uncharacterized delta-60 repeat protein